MKRLLALALSIVLVLGLTVAASATTGTRTATLIFNNVKITLDGKEITPVDANGNPVEPFAIDGTTYLPVRAISNALGLNVGWEQATQTVVLSTPADNHNNVYITRTGSKYHYDKQCNGGTYWQVPMETARGFGLTPCDKCVLTNDHPNG